jgi:hypothetical protein
MVHEEIIEQCQGCQNVDTFRTCRIYLVPSVKWNAGNCPMASHVVKKSPAVMKALDPIKANKRSMKDRK